MRETYIPSSETFVYEKDGVVVGFYSLYQARLAALFVRPDQQRLGVGATLLKNALKRQCPLKLTVYKDNVRGVRFYKHHGFVVVDQAPEKLTEAVELTMRYSDEH